MPRMCRLDRRSAPFVATRVVDLEQNHMRMTCGRINYFERIQRPQALLPNIMSTDTQTAPQPAHQLTILGRVTSIPLVHDSLGYLDSTLSANSYLRTPYATAQAITSSALHYSVPITTRLAPLITRADGLANQGLDVVESRYPYPFKTPTEQISNDLKERTDYARDVANKTIDARVRSPVYTVVNGVDQVRHGMPYRGNKLAQYGNVPLAPHAPRRLPRFDSRAPQRAGRSC